MAWALTAGLAAVVVLTFVNALADGAGQFLAGRLNDPVGYRNATAALMAMAFWPLVCLAAQRGAEPAGACRRVQRRHLGARPRVPDAVARRAARLLLRRGAGAGARARPDPPRVAVDHGRGGRRDRRPQAARALRRLPRHGGQLAVGDRLGDGRAGRCSAIGSFVVGARARAVRRRRCGCPNPRSGAIGQAAAGALVLLTIGAVAGGLIVAGNPVTLVRDKANEFKQLDTAAPGETRLGSTSGQRYDLWRIALNEFELGPADRRRRGQLPAALLRRAQDRPQPLDPAQPAVRRAGRDRADRPAVPARRCRSRRWWRWLAAGGRCRPRRGARRRRCWRPRRCCSASRPSTGCGRSRPWPAWGSPAWRSAWRS